MASDSPSPILQGVLAINKPNGISSAQVIRDAQRHFNPSATFKPWVDNEKAKRGLENHNQKQRRSVAKRACQVKMGHGGTLDPMATGVLILGIGSGTKYLGSFLEGNKTYETVVLFGAASDTYDSEGKVVGRKAHEHITREKVEEALSQFRGDIMQKPPIYSALRIDGKRLYDYAREGQPLPREIESRPVHVESLEVVDWLEGGSHEWHWPEREGDDKDRRAMEALVHLDADPPTSTKTTVDHADPGDATGSKRKRDEVDEPSQERQAKRPEQDPSESSANAQSEQPHEGQPETSASRKPCPASAVRLRMTTASGFYVRSLCHDLGAAVGSLALMTSLVRTQQGQFELGKNVLEYDHLKEGEGVWGPQVASMLEAWQKEHGDDEQGKNANKDAARRHQEKRARRPAPSQPYDRRNTSSEEN
ncbi:pseudouridine synthase [Polychaeton citri CBS 116435]|uniref:tRNA pseudouridine(55) synthase n=1 Tax=Polychaeton citri CBS 116435 TaxID=1314669 RepID=A0A9P4Q3P0_9PEZI|nr:pseudouridine synthase [Polychaeton citri CBS 116435]